MYADQAVHQKHELVLIAQTVFPDLVGNTRRTNNLPLVHKGYHHQPVKRHVPHGGPPLRPADVGVIIVHDDSLFQPYGLTPYAHLIQLVRQRTVPCTAGLHAPVGPRLHCHRPRCLLIQRHIPHLAVSKDDRLLQNVEEDLVEGEIMHTGYSDKRFQPPLVDFPFPLYAPGFHGHDDLGGEIQIEVHYRPVPYYDIIYLLLICPGYDRLIFFGGRYYEWSEILLLDPRLKDLESIGLRRIVIANEAVHRKRGFQSLLYLRWIAEGDDPDISVHPAEIHIGL